MIILDEPTNGLDPAGIREFRALVRELAAGGTTVFVSSHILSEVEQMCDDVAILKTGRLITQGPVATLLKTGVTSSLLVRTTDDTRAAQLLSAAPWVTNVVRQDGRLVVETAAEQAAAVSRMLAEQQIWIEEMRPQEGSLEDFFLDVTGAPGPRGDSSAGGPVNSGNVGTGA
jgi:ABC-2 type transport system ATP-binding protein